MDGQEPETVEVGGGRVAGTFEDGFPFEEVFVGRGTEV